MIWFVLKIKPVESFAKRVSLVLDEFVVIVFLGFAAKWCGEVSDDEASLMRQGYAIIVLLVLTIIKNMAALVYSSARDYKRKKQEKNVLATAEKEKMVHANEGEQRGQPEVRRSDVQRNNWVWNQPRRQSEKRHHVGHYPKDESKHSDEND